MEVSGRKPTSLIKSPTSTKVSVTSPACIGNISFYAGRPSSFSSKRHHIQYLRMLVTDIVESRRRTVRLPLTNLGEPIDQA
jgi:hypothetical protein